MTSKDQLRTIAELKDLSIGLKTMHMLLQANIVDNAIKLLERTAPEPEAEWIVEARELFRQTTFDDGAISMAEWERRRDVLLARPSLPPPAEPVAWRRLVDSAYTLRPEWHYTHQQPTIAPEKWEPVYARSTPTKPAARQKVSQADVNAFFDPDGDGNPRND